MAAQIIPLVPQVPWLGEPRTWEEGQIIVNNEPLDPAIREQASRIIENARKNRQWDTVTGNMLPPGDRRLGYLSKLFLALALLQPDPARGLLLALIEKDDPVAWEALCDAIEERGVDAKALRQAK